MRKVTLFVENSFTRAVCSEASLDKFLYDTLSYKVKDAAIIKRVTGRNWNGIKSFYDNRRKVFLTGLLMRVLKELKAFSIDFEVVDRRAKPNLVPGPYEIEGVELRDYQVRDIEAFLKCSRGTAQWVMGGGKTELAIALVKSLGVPTLFMTHRRQLLHEMADRFKDRLKGLEKNIGLIGDGIFAPRQVTIATVQTLFGMVKSHPDQIVPILNKFQFLIVDEAHRMGADQFNKPASLCNHAFYRLALTATPFMRDDTEEDYYLTGIAGPVFGRVTASELIDRGLLAKPFFKFFDVTEPQDISKLTSWRDIYEKGIVKNEFRNTIIVKQGAKVAEMGKKMLVIVQERAHGQILEQMLNRDGLRCRYIDGKNSRDERQKALKWLSQDRGDAVVCTNIFDEGVSVNEIGSIVMAAGTKSPPAIYQRTGRALRIKEGQENYAVILDFIDYQHKKLLQHSHARLELIKSEPKFTIL